MVEGETLANRLIKGPLSLEQAVQIGVEIAGALDKAHRSGVMHRDFKPGNVMLTATGAKLWIFVGEGVGPGPLDAALTAVIGRPGAGDGGRTIVGTFQYMSPEQIEGKELDRRSDIFVGAVLYEMVTGRRAFEGKSRAS